jgi:hypothetical protein
MMRKLSPVRGNPLYLIMGKSQNALWLTEGMNGKQGFGAATSIGLFPRKIVLCDSSLACRFQEMRSAERMTAAEAKRAAIPRGRVAEAFESSA